MSATHPSRAINRRLFLGGGVALATIPKSLAAFAPRGKGIPRVSLPEFPNGLAVGSSETGAGWARSLSATPLVRMTPEGVISGGLAIDWNQSPDRTSIELQIRPDALFSDGTLITVEDVMASLDHALDIHADTPEAWRWERLASWEVVSPETIRLDLSEPDASVFALLASHLVTVYPKSWIDTGWDPLNGPFPPSSGCFELASATSERLRFNRNDGFFQIGRPRLAGVLCNAPQPTIPRTTELVTNGVDILIDAPLLDVPTLREDPNIVLVGGPSNRLCQLTVNLASTVVADPRMRRLVATAIDRQALVKAATGGEAVAASSLIPVDHWAGLEFAFEVADPDDVRARLTELGEPPGVELRLVASETDASLANACVLLQEQLAWAGIAISLDLLDETQMRDAMESGNWDLVMSYTPYWRDPNELIRPLVVSDGVLNLSGYSQDRVDYLARLAVRAATNTYRAGFYRTIQGIIINDAPVIPLFFPNYYDAMATKIQNYPFFHPISSNAMNQAVMVTPEPATLP